MTPWLLVIALGCEPADPDPAEATPSVKEPVVAPVNPGACPTGMVRIEGSGTVGMKGQPYGIVVTKHLDRVEAPERGCSAAIARTPGATACWVQTDQTDPVLRPRSVHVEPFCIDRFPFPGEGAEYTTDGMTAWAAARLDEALGSGRYGPRRLCSTTEFQVAVAGLKANHRFIYGDRYRPERCSGDAIGVDPACRNPETEVSDYAAVHSHWTRADSAFVQSSCDSPPCRGAGNRPLTVGALVVAGGTGRAQTRQAPFTPHTWHDHGDPSRGPCNDQGWDDQAVICADPAPVYEQDPLPEAVREQEAAWAHLVAVGRQTHLMSAVLSEALGRPVCGP